MTSRITPKNTVSFTHSILLLSILNRYRSSVCLLKFDFLKLMDSLLAQHHCVNLHVSELKV